MTTTDPLSRQNALALDIHERTMRKWRSGERAMPLQVFVRVCEAAKLTDDEVTDAAWRLSDLRDPEPLTVVQAMLVADALGVSLAGIPSALRELAATERDWSD